MSVTDFRAATQRRANKGWAEAHGQFEVRRSSEDRETSEVPLSRLAYARGSPLMENAGQALKVTGLCRGCAIHSEAPISAPRGVSFLCRLSTRGAWQGDHSNVVPLSKTVSDKFGF
jgi:hypothetical protein